MMMKYDKRKKAAICNALVSTCVLLVKPMKSLSSQSHILVSVYVALDQIHVLLSYAMKSQSHC